tara:strand:+ start:2445 stop:4373 length:1929 start_codon:yes stop_codon:yes gene_type:complete
MATFYDDGGVDFAQEQFDKARERRDRTAKSEDKSNRNLLGFNALLSGAELFLNTQADKLETDNLLAKAHYLSANENAKMFNKEYNDYINQGLEMEDIFQLQTVDKLNEYIIAEYGEGYKSDAVKEIARQYTSNPDNLEAYKKMVESYQKIPGLTSEEMVEILRRDEMPPRTVAEFFGNGLKKIFKSHDADTLTEEDKLAKQRKLGGLLGADYDNLKIAIQEFGDQDNPIDDLVEAIKNNPEALVYKNAQQSTVQVPMRDSYGNETLVTKIVSTGVGANNQPIIFGEVVVGKGEKKGPRTEVDPSQAPIVMAQIDNIIGGIATENSNAGLQWEEVSKRGNDSFKIGTTLNIMNTVEELKRTYNMNDAMALPLATEFILNQGNESNIDTIMSQFDIDKLRGQVDTRNFPMYIENINKNINNPFIRKTKILDMRNDIVDKINQTMEGDSKRKELNALDSIMIENNLPTLEEENNAKLANANIPKEEKDFLEEVNQQSIFMKSMNDVIFGADGKLSATEAITLLIPGYGLYKGLRFGGALALNTFVRQSASKVISDPKTAKFIARAKKFVNPNQKGRDAFINNLSPTQKVIFENMNKNGTIVNLTKFQNDIALMKGTYLMSQVARVKMPLLYGAGGGLFIYARDRD